MHEGHHDHCCGHDHEHECCGHSHEHVHAAGNTGANETVALLDYMLKHNEHHTIELETVRQQLETMGLAEAANQMGAVIEEYQKGNVRLAAVLASIKDALK